MGMRMGGDDWLRDAFLFEVRRQSSADAHAAVIELPRRAIARLEDLAAVVPGTPALPEVGYAMPSRAQGPRRLASRFTSPIGISASPFWFHQ
jgi:hypothetical protein